MKEEPSLPPSLAVVPNIPPRRQTPDQLRAERDYWQAKLDIATCWGAATSAVASFRDECDRELNRRTNP